jgi:CheY-like chemotaxis protein
MGRGVNNMEGRGVSFEWVRISISDTGRGIPPEKLPHIFDRFYQADDAYTKDQEGSGIGLALTKELVKLHYGKIEVESTPGEGTVFTVYLPMGKGHLKPDEIISRIPEQDISTGAETDKNSFASAQEYIEPLKKAKEMPEDDDLFDLTKENRPFLLIVEDNDDLRAYIRSYLDADYLVSEAFDGEMGLQKAIEKIPDLIVSDVMMPKMDGVQLCSKLKTDERTSHIPVILLTAKAAMEDKLEGLETGADDFITKPFDPQELLVRIKSLIKQRAKLHEIYSKSIDAEFKPEDVGQSIDQQFLLKAKNILAKKITDPLFGVDAFAEAMALSRVQLHRKLKALINLSPGDYIRSIRLNQAAKLLKSKSGTVTEIAYQVGFNSLSWFAKCFHERFGVNPSEYQ